MNFGKILIADDEPDILEIITYNLSSEGYEVISARNGNEAIDPAQQNHINISRGIIEVMQDKSNITGNDYDNSEGKVPTEWNIIS